MTHVLIKLVLPLIVGYLAGNFIVANFAAIVQALDVWGPG